MTYFQMSMRTSKEFDKDVICNFVCTFFNLPRNSLTQYDANDDVAEMDHGIGAWPANQAFRKCLRCLTHFEKKKEVVFVLRKPSENRLRRSYEQFIKMTNIYCL